MFGTLHCNSGSNEAQFLERSNGQIEHGGTATARFACDNCRAKKLKCDGQKRGCFRCKASSSLCLYTTYSSKKDSRQKSEASHRARPAKQRPCQNETSQARPVSTRDQTSRKDACEGTSETTDRSMSGDYPLQYDDIGGMSSMTEGGTQDLSLDDGELLFDRLIPDLVSNNGAQGKDPLASGISHPSDNGLGSSFSYQIPSPDLTSPSAPFSPFLSPFDTVEESTSLWSIDHETETHLTSPTNKSGSALKVRADGSFSTDTRAICQCSQTMVILLGELDGLCYGDEARSMPIVLAQVKNALQQCNQTLHCNHCSLLSDPMMLAAVIVSKVVSTLGSAISVFVARPKASRSRFDNHLSNNRLNISVGGYVIDSEVEWAAVIKALITILLRRTLDLLLSLSQIAKANSRDAQLSMLQATEQKARSIVRTVQMGTAARGADEN